MAAVSTTPFNPQLFSVFNCLYEADALIVDPYEFNDNEVVDGSFEVAYRRWSPYDLLLDRITSGDFYAEGESSSSSSRRTRTSSNVTVVAGETNRSTFDAPTAT